MQIELSRYVKALGNHNMLCIYEAELFSVINKVKAATAAAVG